jgi:N-methylhydantoinase A
LRDEDIRLVETSFHDLHEQHYTFRLDAPIEFVNFHLTAFGPVEKPELPELGINQDTDGARKGVRIVDYDELGRCEASIFERESLGAEARIDGPAVIADPAASTVVFPGQHVEVDRWGNLIIEGAPE